MTATAFALAAILAVAGVVDGAFSGYRASLGHDGLVDHGRTDWRGARRGALVAALALIPAGLVAGSAFAARTAALVELESGARVLLWSVGPYGTVMAALLAVYWLLPWRARFLASSMLLGPLSLARPLVIVVGVLAVASLERGALSTAVALLGAAGVLAVEPFLTRIEARQAAGRRAARRGDELPPRPAGAY